MRQELKTYVNVAVLLWAAITASAICAQNEQGPVPLYDDLGDYHVEIATTVPLAQRYFDQGMRLYYAFNHAEAVRAFREAQRLDPDCAICWWGEALAFGPNINLPMDKPSAQAAFAALEQAQARKASGSGREQALIEALASRYVAGAPDERAGLDQAYADAMAQLVARHPADLEMAVLYAESLMDLRPWDYWTEQGTPKPGIGEALSRLERVLAQRPDHPGACHFYIHAVEEIYPERAVPCAERLANLMPGAGHLVHMPGHIYIRVGRYLEAVDANQHAVHADETYIQDQHPGMGMYTAGYYPHNYDFLAFAAMMIGRSATAIDAAEKVTSLLPAELFGSPGMDFLQHWSARPLQMEVRFGRWQDILDRPSPPAEYAFARGIWHYARGRALVATHELSAAAEELESLRALTAGEKLAGLKMEFNQASDLLAVAERVLSAWYMLAADRSAAAVEAMSEAVRLEDGLLYGEPPEWSVPTRQDLGSVLLRAGQFERAEQAFREDLAKFPENGWSLFGLMRSLQAQGRQAEADVVEADLNRIWSTADVELEAIF